MELLGGSGVKESVNSSVEEFKEQKDGVEVESLRSPQELISRVDRLEEVVEGLRERQKQIAENHSEDIHSLELDEAIDLAEVENKISEGSAVDLGNIEKRLENLEVAINRVESSFELESEELRENIIEEAIEMENERLREVLQRIDNLEKELKSSEIEEKVDKSELDQRLKEIREEEQNIEDVKEKLRNLEIGEDIISSELDSKSENLKEFLLEEISSAYGRRLDEMESELDRLQEEVLFEGSDNIIDREELEARIDEVKESRKKVKQSLSNQIHELDEKISESNIEEKVDHSQLEKRLEDLQDDLEWKLGEKENSLRQEIDEKTGLSSLEELEEELRILVEKNNAETEKRLESLEKKVEQIPDNEAESAPEEQSQGVSQEEFSELTEKVEEMSDLLVKVAKQNQ